jgi:transposase
MTLHARDRFKIPTNTARVARAAFPKGNVYITMRDKVDIRYKDSDFADLFTSCQGRPAESPGMLALITVMQYAEGLTDRQAAEAVRARIDWKYTLGLRLEDQGFHFSVLGAFRDRVLAGGAEQRLLDDMLQQFREQELVKARGRQRTDSTHVLAAIRKLNRLECVGETLRAALNVLAAAAPEWLLEQVTPDWFERYGARFEQYRLPKERVEQDELGATIGVDGYHLLSAIYADCALPWLREVPAVDVLRRVWVQQYAMIDGELNWRAAKDLPPNSLLIESPYDVEARNRTKRTTNWTGYTVHLTETCDADKPNLITHVETTPATTSDVEMTDTIHQALEEKNLLPGEHLVDTGYVDAEHLVTSETEYDLDLCGPALPDPSWQSKDESAFDVACFAIDWEAQQVRCPQGKVSHSWHTRTEKSLPVIQVRFSSKDCTGCAARSRCTRAKTSARVLTFKPKAQYEALQAARQRQKTLEFKERYKARAGAEGTISQGTRAFGLRRSRYIGLAKTRFAHIVTAAAMNLTRTVSWVMGVPKAQTRVSHFAALAPIT